MDLIDKVINNIKAEMKRQGIKQKEFAERMDHGESYISHVLSQKKGGADSFTFIEKAAKALNVSVDELLPLEVPASQYTYLKDMSNNFSDATFKTTWLERFNADELFIHFMPDDSMFPTIKNGDMLLVAKRTSIDHDGVYLFQSGKNISVRRVILQLNSQITVHSDNNLIPPSVMQKEELNATLLGQVVWLGRDL